MSNYRRADFPGGYYFFTLVTYNRRKLFATKLGRKCLRYALVKIKNKRPFESIALCLLPEHLHCIWKLPADDSDFSIRWNSIKAVFTKSYLRQGGNDGFRNSSRNRKGEAAIWQRRFWEHQIKDENDLQKHVDCIHYNPIKHGLVETLEEWEWSTYHKYVKKGFYGGATIKRLANIQEDKVFAGE